MPYILVFAVGFLVGFVAMSMFAMCGSQDTLDELADAYKLIGVLWKRVNDAESLLILDGRTVTLHAEDGQHVEMRVEAHA